MKKVKHFLANQLARVLKNPIVRYKFVLPLADLLIKNSDEEILEKAMKYTAHAGIGGDYLEFGVWKGRSFVRAYYMKKYVKNTKLNKMKFYAFDSFEGLPEIKNSLDSESGEFKKGDYYCDIETFKSILGNNKVNMKDVVLVPGWYDKVLNQETKNKLELKKASIIYVDCDLYESAVSVLDFITDYVVDGTIIIFDDWFVFKGDPNRGEQKAFREWLEKNPSIKATEWQRINWKTNSFILRKNG